MNIQLIIVIAIIVAAAAYVGRMAWLKAKATTGKGDCGTDCGCGPGAKKAK